MKDLAVAKLQSDLASLQSRLEYSLKDLAHQIQQARDALKRGDVLDPLMMKNHVDIDALSVDINRIRQTLEFLK